MRKHLFLHVTGIALILSITVFIHDVQVLRSFTEAENLHASASVDSEQIVRYQIASIDERVAARLQKRILRSFGKDIPLPALVNAVDGRQALLQRSLTLQPVASDGAVFAPLDGSISAHPSWIRPAMAGTDFEFLLDGDAVQSQLQEWASQLTAPVDSTVVSTESRHGVTYAIVDHLASAGYQVDVPSLTSNVVQAYQGTGASLAFPVNFVTGKVLPNSAEASGGEVLTLLASGRSNFAGSGLGRISNVRTGLTQYINNIVVPAGETFSFNAAVNNMRSNDWEDALVIMNGTDLVSYPGGGICQVATTVYRAALLAGLPIKERANHSLYVTYYEKYGVGIDATVFPQKQDLQFVNDTGHPLILQSGYDGFDAYVNLYGISDGRSVRLEGPYFETNATQSVKDALGSPFQSNEIAWLQYVRSPDGTEQTHVVVSRYSSLPRSLKAQYAQLPNAST